MPNAFVSDVVTTARDYIDEPASAGRFSDAFMIRRVSEASKYMNRDIMFPDARYVITTVANVQEYVCDPTFLRTDRVYLNGQLLVPVDSDLNTVEGHQIGLYDQSSGTTSNLSPVVNSGIQPLGSGAPPGGQGVYTPQWIAAEPVTYPATNNSLPCGGGLPSGLPYQPGDRGRYYWRGTTFGTIPACASSGSVLVIEGILMVPSVTALNQALYFPDSLIPALAWKVCEVAKFSDDSDRAAESRNYAASQYDAQMRQWRTWNRRRTGDQPRTTFLRTNRSSYLQGNRRFLGNGGGGYP